MYLDELKYDSRGLIPVVVCDAATNQVLMVAWMNQEALQRTVDTGLATYYSRSRQKLWVKGETSGHTQKVRWLRTDCDGDVLLLGVEQVGGACHEGYASCFFRELRDGHWQVVADRVFDPGQAYQRE